MRRLPSEKYNPGCTTAKVQRGGGSVRIWACLPGKKNDELYFGYEIVNSEKYISIM